MKKLFLVCVVLLMWVLSGEKTFAQGSNPVFVDRERKNIIDANPLNFLIGIYQVGYERALSKKISFEIKPSVFAIYPLVFSLSTSGSSLIFFFLESSVNFYVLPQHKAPKGFYLAPVLRGGVLLNNNNNLSIVTIGGDAGYQFIFNGGFSLDLAGGLAGFFSSSFIPLITPTFRASLGYAF